MIEGLVENIMDKIYKCLKRMFKNNKKQNYSKKQTYFAEGEIEGLEVGADDGC